MASSFLDTLSGGIQDISAVLSLIGTEQCELHVGSALRGGSRGGYLYAAVTPLSIFGSLGVAKAAFSIMIASVPRIGAKRLQHLGFDPAGNAINMISLQDDCYVAEGCLLSLLDRYFITDVQGLEVPDARLLWFSTWNLWLLFFSLLVAAVGTIPYLLFSIRHDTSFLSLAIFFPLCRVTGGVLCVFIGQLLLQHRIALIIRQRVVFKQINDLLKGLNDVPLPTGCGLVWKESIASEHCLRSLYQFLYTEEAKAARQWSFIHHVTVYLKPPRTAKTPGILVSLRRLVEMIAKSLGCFCLGSDTQQVQDLNPNRNPEHPGQNHDLWTQAAHDSDLDKAKEAVTPLVTIPFSFIALECAILLGFVMTVIGYIGCFAVVQDRRSTTTEIYLWLLLELVLALGRFGIWAWNPLFDDPSEIEFTYELDSTSKKPAFQTPVPVDIYPEGKRGFKIVNENTFWRNLTKYSGPVNIEAIPKLDGYQYWYAWVRQNDQENGLCVLVKGEHRIMCLPGRLTDANGNHFEEPLFHLAETFESARLGDAVVLTSDRLVDTEATSTLQNSILKHHDFITAVNNRRESDKVYIKTSWLLSHSSVHVRATQEDSPPTSLDFKDNEAWTKIIQPTVTSLLVENECLYTALMGSYTAIYNNQSSFQEIYNLLSTELTKNAQRIGNEIPVDSAAKQLEYYDNEWRTYSTAIIQLDRICTYLNRHWVKKLQDEGHRDVDRILNVALTAWKDTVLSNPKMRASEILRFNQVSAYFTSRDLTRKDFQNMYLSSVNTMEEMPALRGAAQNAEEEESE